MTILEINPRFVDVLIVADENGRNCPDGSCVWTIPDHTEKMKKYIKDRIVLTDFATLEESDVFEGFAGVAIVIVPDGPMARTRTVQDGFYTYYEPDYASAMLRAWRVDGPRLKTDRVVVFGHSELLKQALCMADYATLTLVQDEEMTPWAKSPNNPPDRLEIDFRHYDEVPQGYGPMSAIAALLDLNNDAKRHVTRRDPETGIPRIARSYYHFKRKEKEESK